MNLLPTIATALALLLGLLVTSARADVAMLSEGLAALRDPSFQVKEQGIAKIADSGQEQSRAILEALGEGRLHVRLRDQVVVTSVETDGVLSIAEAATGAPAGTVEKSELKKIAINNQMRLALREALARLSLRATDAAARKSAVESLYASLTPETLDLLREALSSEKDAGVRDALGTALALASLGTSDRDGRLAAIAVLRASMTRDGWAAASSRSAPSATSAGTTPGRARSAATSSRRRSRPRAGADDGR